MVRKSDGKKASQIIIRSLEKNLGAKELRNLYKESKEIEDKFRKSQALLAVVSAGLKQDKVEFPFLEEISKEIPLTRFKVYALRKLIEYAIEKVKEYFEKVKEITDENPENKWIQQEKEIIEAIIKRNIENSLNKN